MAMKTIDQLSRRCTDEDLKRIFHNLLRRWSMLYGPLSPHDTCIELLTKFWSGEPLRERRTHAYVVCNKHYKLTYWAWMSGYFYLKCQPRVFRMITGRVGYLVKKRPPTVRRYFMQRGPEWYYPTDVVGLSFVHASGGQSLIYINTTPVSVLDIPVESLVNVLQDSGFIVPFREGYYHLRKPFRTQLTRLCEAIVDVTQLNALKDTIATIGWDYIQQVLHRFMSRKPVAMAEAILVGYIIYILTRTLRFGSGVSIARELFGGDEIRIRLFDEISELVLNLPEVKALIQERHHSRVRLFQRKGVADHGAEEQEEIAEEAIA